MTESRTFAYPPSIHWLYRYVGGPSLLVLGGVGLVNGVVKVTRTLLGTRSFYVGDLVFLGMGFALLVAGGAIATSRPSLRAQPDGLAVQVFGPLWLKVKWEEIEQIRQVAPDVRLDKDVRHYHVQNYVIGLRRYLTPWHTRTVAMHSKWWRAAIWISEDMEDVDELLALICDRSGIQIEA